MTTKYNHLTNDEMLMSCREAREKSPIINELCRRLEAPDDPSTELYDIEEVHYCPVCEAPLAIGSQETDSAEKPDSYTVRSVVP